MQDGSTLVSCHRSCQQIGSAGHAVTDCTVGMLQGRTHADIGTCLAAEHASPVCTCGMAHAVPDSTAPVDNHLGRRNVQPGATQQGALQALPFPSARCHRSLCAPEACCKPNCGGIAPDGPPLAPPSGRHRSAQLPPAVLPQCWPQCPAGTGERPVDACSKQPAQQGDGQMACAASQ